MSNQAVRTATEKTAEATTFPGMLKQYQGEIARALPKHINPDRMTRIALTEFRKNPQLANCSPASIFAAVVIGAQLGLEPGMLGQSYLVPYKGECQFIPGWQGYVDLVARAGRASVWTQAVFEGDDFDYGLGDRPYIQHKPRGEDDPKKLTHCYAVGRIKNAEYPVVEVWSRARIERHRDRFNKVGNRHYSFQHFEMYGRKVALLQVLKYMPKSAELVLAVDLQNAADSGKQGLDVNSVLEGTWAPVTQPDQGAGGGDDAQGAIPQYDEASALTTIRGSGSLEALDKNFKAIAKDFSDTNRPLPVSVEAARNDRRAALEQGNKL